MPKMSLWDLELTETESMMKKYMESQPRIRGKILTAEELSSFTLRSIAAYAPTFHPAENDYEKIPDVVREILGKAQANQPVDMENISLSEFFAHQSERGYIAESYDVDVMRVVRYMPVHWHTNQYFTVLYCVDGICPVLFKNESVNLKSGDVMVLAPDTLYASPCYEDDAVLIYYAVRSSTFYDVFWNNLSDVPLLSEFFAKILQGNRENPYLIFPTGDDADIHKVLYDIWQEANQKQLYAGHMINCLMNLFFIILLRRYAGKVILSSKNAFQWKPEYAAVLQYIQQHFTSVSVRELALRFHYSERQINRIIQVCTGKTFSILRQELRIKYAMKLLQTSGSSVQRIGEMAGYGHIAGFYKAFHAVTGMSPVEFRNSCPENDRRSLRE